MQNPTLLTLLASFTIDFTFIPAVNICVMFFYGGLHSGGCTRHLHTATIIQKLVADLSDSVGEHQGGETITVRKAFFAYSVQGGVPHVDTL